jgi:hypothetical protein
VHEPRWLSRYSDLLRLEDPQVAFPVLVGLPDLFAPQQADRLCGPPSLLFKVYSRMYHCGVKWQERDAEFSPVTSAKYKNTWSYTPIPPYISWRIAYLSIRKSLSYRPPCGVETWANPLGLESRQRGCENWALRAGGSGLRAQGSGLRGTSDKGSEATVSRGNP